MATISGSTELALRLAMERTERRYGGNVEFDSTGSNFRRGDIRKRGTGSVLAFRLNVKSSHGPGHRVTAVSAYAGGKSRRLRAACWHVWRDFLTELFAIEPTAVVRTALATYQGKDGFEENFPETYFKNAGSLAFPQYYGSLCECEAESERKYLTG